ncbi:MAG TPA: hypothetical protein VGR35_14815 [Tepidisphaeraceae bacterium]|nr:hypothetical protein [Tepidisphaeraceae bacterium]
MQVVALLPTSRPTHLARSDDAMIWWVQESEQGQEAAFALGADGVPRATALTAGRVLAALDLVSSPAVRASGNFHSLAAGPDGRVWFYFAGGAGRRAASCVGTFDARDGAIRIVVNDTQLASATGMGRSLVLARGTLIARGDDLSLWVRHSDAAGLFRIDPNSGGVLRPFDTVTTQSGERLTLTRPDLAMGAAPDGLLLLDPGRVELWRIDSAGRAFSLHTLVGLPTFLSAPSADATGRAFLVAADAPLIPARTDEEAHQVLPVRYPALLIIESGKLRAIGRDDMTAPEGFALPEMRVQQLLADPQTQSLIGYDEKSGALVRFRLVNNPVTVP